MQAIEVSRPVTDPQSRDRLEDMQLRDDAADRLELWSNE